MKTEVPFCPLPKSCLILRDLSSYIIILVNMLYTELELRETCTGFYRT